MEKLYCLLDFFVPLPVSSFFSKPHPHPHPRPPLVSPLPPPSISSHLHTSSPRRSITPPLSPLVLVVVVVASNSQAEQRQQRAAPRISSSGAPATASPVDHGRAVLDFRRSSNRPIRSISFGDLGGHSIGS